MTANAKISGAWKDVPDIQAKVSGAWKTVDEGYSKISGVWKQFYSAVAPSNYDLLETVELTSSASSVDFTGLGSYTDYKHLQIRMITSSTRSNAADGINMRMNGVSTSSYTSHELRGDGSSVTAHAYTSETSMRLGITSAANSTNNFAGGVVDILDFADSSKNTTIRSFTGMTSFNTVRLNSGLFINTAAITSISIFASNGNVAADSRISLYGIKDS